MAFGGLSGSRCCPGLTEAQTTSCDTFFRDVAAVSTNTPDKHAQMSGRMWGRFYDGWRHDEPVAELSGMKDLPLKLTTYSQVGRLQEDVPLGQEVFVRFQRRAGAKVFVGCHQNGLSGEFTWRFCDGSGRQVPTEPIEFQYDRPRETIFREAMQHLEKIDRLRVMEWNERLANIAIRHKVAQWASQGGLSLSYHRAERIDLPEGTVNLHQHLLEAGRALDAFLNDQGIAGAFS